MKPETLFAWLKVVITLVLIGVIVWLAREIFAKGKDTVAAVKEGAGFLFGTSNNETLGTKLHNLFNPEPTTRADGKPAYWDDAQAAKTQAIIDARKSGMNKTVSQGGSYTFITPETLDSLRY